jgi:hypothetical protein
VRAAALQLYTDSKDVNATLSFFAGIKSLSPARLQLAPARSTLAEGDNLNPGLHAPNACFDHNFAVTIHSRVKYWYLREKISTAQDMRTGGASFRAYRPLVRELSCNTTRARACTLDRSR